MKERVRQVIFILTILVLIISFFWSIFDFGFEAMLAFIGALIALLVFLVDGIKTTHSDEDLIKAVSFKSIIETFKDIIIGPKSESQKWQEAEEKAKGKIISRLNSDFPMVQVRITDSKKDGKWQMMMVEAREPRLSKGNPLDIQWKMLGKYRIIIDIDGDIIEMSPT